MNPRLLSIRARAMRTVTCLSLVVCFSGLTLAQAPVSVTITGPYSFKDTPVDPSYKITVSNISLNPAFNVSLSNTLSQNDGSYLVAAQSSQGSCDLGGLGITVLNCAIGNLDPGASVTVDVVSRLVSGTITLSSSASGVDFNGSFFAAGPAQRTTVHGNPPAGTPVVSIALSANPVPKDVVGGRTGTLNWTLQNSTGVRANKLVMAMVIDSRLRITSSVVTGSNSSDPVSCNAPVPSDSGTTVVTCNIEYLGGSTSGSGGVATVTQLQVTVNYTSTFVSSQTTMTTAGYLSFEGSDSSNPIAIGQVRVK
jgi:hypothetical protein